MSSVFVPQHIRGNKAAVTQETIQKLLDENSHLIQCIVDNQSTGNVRESTQYQQILHRNLVWLATVADSNQSTPQNMLSSSKQGAVGAQPPLKMMRSEAPPPSSTPAIQPPSATELSPNQQPQAAKVGTPKPNEPSPIAMPYSSPQPNRASPQAKPGFNSQQQQGSMPPQYRQSPNSTGRRTPMRSPVDPTQQVHRQSPLAGSQIPQQYQQQSQAMTRNPNQTPVSSYPQQPSSYPQPQVSYNQQQPTSYSQPAASFPQQTAFPQPMPASYSQAPGYSQAPVSFSQQQPGLYTQQPGPQGPYAPTSGSYPSGVPQAAPPNNFPQGTPPHAQYPASSQGMMQGQPRPYYGRPAPSPASGGYSGYPTSSNQPMPPPGQQQMPQYQQSASYPQQYGGNQLQPTPQYTQPPQQAPPQQNIPYQQ